MEMEQKQERLTVTAEECARYLLALEPGRLTAEAKETSLLAEAKEENAH